MAKQNPTYGLFRKEGRRWIREYPALAFRQPQASEMFQTLLLAGPNRMLRPAKREPLT